MGQEILFTLKDLVYLSSIIMTISGVFFGLKILVSKNKSKIQHLEYQLIDLKNEKNEIRTDLIEVKGLLMEIKGFLQIK